MLLIDWKFDTQFFIERGKDEQKGEYNPHLIIPIFAQILADNANFILDNDYTKFNTKLFYEKASKILTSIYS
jgi:hypothetical protein